jgi:hypothetical protein
MTLSIEIEVDQYESEFGGCMYTHISKLPDSATRHDMVRISLFVQSSVQLASLPRRPVETELQDMETVSQATTSGQQGRHA